MVQRLGILLLLLSGCGGVAQTATTPPPPSFEGSAFERRALVAWEVRSEGGARSTILGTFHVGVEIEDALPRPHLARIASARRLILEVSPEEMDPQALQALALLPDGERLSEQLPEDVWRALVAELPIPAQQLDRLRPWAAMSVVMAQELTGDASESGGAGQASEAPRLDLQVGAIASEHGVETVGLETADEQAAILTSLPSEAIIEYLRAALLGDADADHVGARELREMYLAGDLERLVEVVLDPEEMAEAPMFYETMFFARNDRWLDVLRPELERGGVFCAVGAGHLLGERGLVAQLERSGFTVERLLAE